MSQVATAMAAAGTVKIEQRTHKLDFKVKHTNDAAFTTAQFVSALNDLTFEMFKQSGTGAQIPVIQKTSLGDLAILALSNEGYLVFSNDGTHGYSYFSIELSDFGAIPLVNGDQLEINIAGTFNSNTIDVWAVDTDMLSRTHNTVSKVAFTADTPKPIGVENVKTLGFQASQVDRVELEYVNGTKVVRTLDELKQYVRDGKGFIGSNAGSVFTGADLSLLLVPVSNVRTATITLNADGKVYKLAHEEL